MFNARDIHMVGDFLNEFLRVIRKKTENKNKMIEDETQENSCSIIFNDLLRVYCNNNKKLEEILIEMLMLKKKQNKR